MLSKRGFRVRRCVPEEDVNVSMIAPIFFLLLSPLEEQVVYESSAINVGLGKGISRAPTSN